MEMPRAIAIRRTALRWLRSWCWGESDMARKGWGRGDRTTTVAHWGPEARRRPARRSGARPARRDGRGHARPGSRRGREGGVGRELLHLTFPFRAGGRHVVQQSTHGLHATAHDAASG